MDEEVHINLPDSVGWHLTRRQYNSLCGRTDVPFSRMVNPPTRNMAATNVYRLYLVTFCKECRMKVWHVGLSYVVSTLDKSYLLSNETSPASIVFAIIVIGTSN